MSEQTRLRRQPSSRRWRLELTRILVGEREAEIQSIGGAQQYVARYLFDSDDRAKAEVAFQSALNELVSSWQPAQDEAKGPYFTRTLLELIAAHTPLGGFKKVLGHITNWGEFGVGKWEQADRARINNLALLTLQRYYQIAPPSTEHDSAFTAYGNFLWACLDHPGKEGHALRRLLELGLISPGDDRVAQVVRKPGVVPEIVQYAFSMRRADLMRYAGYILGYCLRLDRVGSDSANPRYKHYEEFKASLEASGGKLKHGEQFPEVHLADGVVIELLLRPDAEYQYMEMREREFRAAGKAAWASIEDEAI